MIIGLTGGIGSGKSLIANAMKEYGLPVVDADLIAREVAEPGETAYDKIVDTFGPDVLERDGTIARKKLGQIIFGDASNRHKLNEIMHPAIRERMEEKKNQYKKEGFSTIIFDIPLLIEGGRQSAVDKVLLVYVDETVQKKRLMDRDGQGEEDANNRIASQMPLKEKKAHADAVIDNNGSREESLEQLKHILKEWNV